jgi:N,N'-diacetyllegionaminate synthase
MLERLGLSAEKYRIFSERAKALGMTFFAAPFDIGSVRALRRLGNPIYKIPSGEITNLPYLVEIAKLKARVFLSTGMSSMDEIRDAVRILGGLASDMTLLHCHTQYPTGFGDANLAAMATMRRETGLRVGYSDHTPGIEASVAAVALGAAVIEKHFTLCRSLSGPDHKASLEPDEFSNLVRSIRNVEMALGDGHKKATESEARIAPIARKSIVAARAIKSGETITDRMLAAKRPGYGISPMRWRDVVGTAAVRDYAPDDMIEL